MPPLLFDGKVWERQLQAWYKKHRPDVILHSHVHVEPVLRRMGLDISRDVGLAHLDLSMFSREHGPGMAGINQNWPEVGAAMVDTVIAQMLANERGIPEHPRTVQIEGQWVDGASVVRREHGV